MSKLPMRAFLSGTIGAVSSAAALAMAAKAEGKAPAQPINATSHWIAGAGAGRQRRIDGRHTGVGFGTHLAATVFWAGLFETWAGRPDRRRDTIVVGACAVAALAAATDYTITPKRFTPGWEFVLSKQAMAAGYLAMAAGFVAARMIMSRGAA